MCLCVLFFCVSPISIYVNKVAREFCERKKNRVRSTRRISSMTIVNTHTPMSARALRTRTHRHTQSLPQKLFSSTILLLSLSFFLFLFSVFFCAIPMNDEISLLFIYCCYYYSYFGGLSKQPKAKTTKKMILWRKKTRNLQHYQNATTQFDMIESMCRYS